MPRRVDSDHLRGTYTKPRPVSALESFICNVETRVLYELLARVASPELEKLGTCCTLIRDVVLGYKKHAWNINDFFGYWFSDPDGFRGILAFTGGIVGGSQVLRFLERQGPNQKSDLDVITRLGGTFAIVRFLEGQGYKLHIGGQLTPDSNYSTAFHAFQLSSTAAFDAGGSKVGLIRVLDYLKPAGDHIAKKVQIIVVAREPAEHIVMSYHSSKWSCLVAGRDLTLCTAGVMNFITHREAVSVFPRTTFLENTFWVCSRQDLGPNWDPSWAKKYIDRGYAIESRRATTSIPSTTRYLLDRFCWTLTFKGEQVDRAALFSST